MSAIPTPEDLQVPEKSNYTDQQIYDHFYKHKYSLEEYETWYSSGIVYDSLCQKHEKLADQYQPSANQKAKEYIDSFITEEIQQLGSKHYLYYNRGGLEQYLTDVFMYKNNPEISALSERIKEAEKRKEFATKVKEIIDELKTKGEYHLVVDNVDEKYLDAHYYKYHIQTLEAVRFLSLKGYKLDYLCSQRNNILTMHLTLKIK